MSGIRHSTSGARIVAIGACAALAACTSATETKNPVSGAAAPLVPSIVRVTPRAATMNPGDDVQLVVDVLTEHQLEIRNAIVSWASSALAVATVSASG